VDGSTISMPDTPQNQACYPQPITQASGVGFPLARVLAVICLSTGAVLEAATCPFAGPGNSELGLLRALGEVFNAGDVMLADTFYCNYFIIATLQAAGVDALFEQHSQRITDFRRGRSLGTRDHCVSWPKPRRPPWCSAGGKLERMSRLQTELEPTDRCWIDSKLFLQFTRRQIADA
jgi:hypothetical protein